jgi:hypothetical protein
MGARVLFVSIGHPGRPCTLLGIYCSEFRSRNKGESPNGVLLAYLDFARAIDKNLHNHGPL